MASAFTLSTLRFTLFGMPTTIHGELLPLSATTIEKLWQVTRSYRDFPDEEVAIAAISEDEIRELQVTYRKKNDPTNVLTFSYENDHDVVICLSIIEQEAAARGVALADYTALILVHAFLHVTGMDHEESASAAAETQAAERAILGQTGFESAAL